jgi:hypothetical protein
MVAQLAVQAVAAVWVALLDMLEHLIKVTLAAMVM